MYVKLGLAVQTPSWQLWQLLCPPFAAAHVLFIQNKASVSEINKYLPLFSHSGQAVLEEFEAHLAKEEARRDSADEELQRSSNILVQVKAGVEHLSGKLHHLKAVRFWTF